MCFFVRKFSSWLVQLIQVQYMINTGALKINFLACFNRDVCDNGKNK